MPRLRPTRLLSAALALGLLTTLAFAWLVPGVLHGVLPARWTSATAVELTPPLQVRRSRTPLHDLVQLEPLPATTGFVLGTDGMIDHPPSWVHVPTSWQSINRMDSEAAGFPLRAFVCHASYALTPSRGSFTRTSLEGGIVLSEHSDRFRILPLRPLWPNLLGDAAIWSATWLLALLLAHIARARHRTARGLCPTCAYDLANTPPDLPCPECGANQAAK